MKKKKNAKNTNDINQKIRYRYSEAMQELKELENDTIATLNSQYDELAKGTADGINMPRLKNAMLEESDLLKGASETYGSFAVKLRNESDELKTRVKETERVEKKKAKKFRILPIKPTNAEIDYEEKETSHFAAGATFHKLFWVFFIGSFAGVVIETIWCIITRGHYESRVGLIYGPFNLVYGFGALALTYSLYKYRNRSAVYSGIFWIKTIYPYMATWILKIPNKIGRPLTKILLVFMIFNSFMSAATVFRWYERTEQKPAENIFETYLDNHYPDERMEKIYANLEFKK